MVFNPSCSAATAPACRGSYSYVCVSCVPMPKSQTRIDFPGFFSGNGNVFVSFVMRSEMRAASERKRSHRCWRFLLLSLCVPLDLRDP